MDKLINPQNIINLNVASATYFLRWGGSVCCQGFEYFVHRRHYDSYDITSLVFPCSSGDANPTSPRTQTITLVVQLRTLVASYVSIRQTAATALGGGLHAAGPVRPGWVRFAGLLSCHSNDQEISNVFQILIILVRRAFNQFEESSCNFPVTWNHA